MNYSEKSGVENEPANGREINCPYCGTKNDKDRKSCWSCGKSLAAASDPIRKCQKCGEIYRSIHSACTKCGAPNPKPISEEPAPAVACSNCKAPLDDTRFTLPETAGSFLLYYKVISWIVTVVVAVNGVRACSEVGALAVICFIGGCVIALAANLLIARIVYEIVVVFFEQLKVMRQVRDLLLEKLK